RVILTIFSLSTYYIHALSFPSFFFLMIRPPPRSPLFPYTTLFRSLKAGPRKDTAAVCAGSLQARDRFPSLSTAQHSSRLRPATRSEEHTSELQSLRHLVCRLLLEKKNITNIAPRTSHSSHHHTNRF